MHNATSPDKDLVVDIRLKSFDSNESVNYIVKQYNYREKRLTKLIVYCFKYCCLSADVFISDDKKASALLIHSAWL
ncbi:MAG: hypothetical protein ACXWWC_02950 [Chitinophagaceae bacterium]